MENAFSEIKRKTLATHVVEQLIAYMINAKLKSGDRLPTEYQLASQFKVGRGTIRQAIGSLTFVGIIEVRPKTGIRMLVSSSELSRSSYTISKAGTQEKIEEFVELRIALEQAIAELAAQKASQAEVIKLRKCLDESLCIPMGNFDELQKADLTFHFLLAKASHNSNLERYFSGLRHLIRVWMKQTYSAVMKESFPIPLRQHEDVVTAIEAHDAEKARLAMANHLHSSASRLNMAMLKRDMKSEA